MGERKRQFRGNFLHELSKLGSLHGASVLVVKVDKYPYFFRGKRKLVVGCWHVFWVDDVVFFLFSRWDILQFSWRVCVCVPYFYNLIHVVQFVVHQCWCSREGHMTQLAKGVFFSVTVATWKVHNLKDLGGRSTDDLTWRNSRSVWVSKSKLPSSCPNRSKEQTNIPELPPFVPSARVRTPMISIE